jgi:ABC-2 type transport system ATP-binding protein
LKWTIETESLGKRYGKVTAVEDLSLRVGAGEIYAFLGLNGAGKTTTLRMLLGMIKPTHGSAVVLGKHVRLGSWEPWAQVGYLVEIPHAYPELTVTENLEVARRCHPGTERKAVSLAIDRLGLAAYAHRRAGVLSQGNAQRLGLAKALLHNPRLILLDEPANGLDPSGIVEIRTLLLALTRQEGMTVFMSSHILAEVSRLADRIGIIHEGRLLREMDTAELERERRRRLVVRARDIDSAHRILSAAGHLVKTLPGGILELNQPASIEHPDDIASLLVQAGSPPTQLLVQEEELEQYFLRLVGANGDSSGAGGGNGTQITADERGLVISREPRKKK